MNIDALKTELQILSNVDSPYIINLIEVFITPINFDIIMEYSQGGSLLERINSLLEDGKTFTIDQAAFILRQIMLGLNHAHSKNIIHGDIKLESIAFNEKSTTNLNLKISEFGLSKYYMENIKKIQDRVGTNFYMSPEVLNGSFNEKCDIWSCGVILYILLIGYPPFFSDVEGDNSSIYLKISKIDYSFNNKRKIKLKKNIIFIFIYIFIFFFTFNFI